MGVLETYFCRFVKRPVARFLHFNGLKIRFMPCHEPHCPIVLIQSQRSCDKTKFVARVKGQRSRSNANDTGLWNGRPRNIRFVKQPQARILHFGGLKIRFMPSHEPHCPIVLIQGQSSKVMRKTKFVARAKGQRWRSNANVTGLWNGHPVNVLLPFRETNCSPFSAFGGLKIRFMPIHEPHCPIV